MKKTSKKPIEWRKEEWAQNLEILKPGPTDQDKFHIKEIIEIEKIKTEELLQRLD